MEANSELLLSRPKVEVLLNPAQLILEIAPQRIRCLQVGRGGGKSTGAALDIKNITLDMPRSKNYSLSETYQQGLTRTLPSTIKALELLGWKKDLHFFVCRLPPKSWKWDMPFEPPLDPKHSIFFYNGTAFDLLSQDTNSRGGNYCAGLVDEAQDIDHAKFQSQVIPTMRGEYTRFKDHKTYRRLSLYCSMPRTRRSEWIFEYERLAELFPEEYLWVTGPSKINSYNLPPDWFKDQKRILMPSEYDIEIENIRPKKVIGGFYPHFNDIEHTYVNFNNDYLEGIVDNDNGYNADSFSSMNSMQDGDVVHDEPLEISMDYGAWFNGIVTGQEKANEFAFLTAMSINENDRFEDLLNKWCTYYRLHRTKTVYYWYDHTAIAKDSRAERYYDIVIRVLSSFGWTVVPEYIGQQPSHDDRYKFMGYIYKGDRPELPSVSLNRHHCKYLIISMNGANIKQGRNGFEKDKGDEKKHEIDQRTTTHFSDAHDTLLMGKYAKRLGAQSASMSPVF